MIGKIILVSLANLKFFVFLPSITREDIRAVEGNLCLYPNMQNLDNFEVDIRYESCQPYLYSISISVDAYRLGKRVYFTSKVFQSLHIGNRCEQVSWPSYVQI